ncbi:hypothetical protein BGZ80_001269 [Entomortierella chlamydospora]|uniref:Uncharacterized protein n=1 Tax=Entomortierella chlamydospora TaxID=101097 RepID=A0A9P6MRG3_9FUNG|nr:hypothetical protein BGZ80_001269 [Entomortierella chlamydospora]
MSVPELIQLRTEFAAAGAEMTVVRLGIFSAALRETRYANLAPLMILLGGKVDDALVSVEDMKKMVEMPGIQTLRSQVAGLLSQAGGGRLVQLLNMNPTLLLMNLDAHAKSGEGESKQ